LRHFFTIEDNKTATIMPEIDELCEILASAIERAVNRQEELPEESEWQSNRHTP
jgi:hypothetical protein